MSAKRSLHIGPVGPLPGGIAQVVNVYERTARRYRVTAITTVRGPRDPKSVFLAGLAVVRMSGLRLVSPFVLVGHMSQRGSFVREGILCWFARLLGVPVVITIHGSEFAAFARGHETLVRRALRAARQIIVLSDEAYDTVTALGFHNVHLGRNPVEVPIELPEEKKNIVLFAGEVGKRKGVDVLLEAWARARQPNWELLIIGPLDPAFDHNLLTCDQARYLGVQPASVVHHLQESASIAVLPSRAEALPMFLLESMARGCATISTSVGAIPRLLEPGRGLLVAPGESFALAEALSTYMQSPDIRCKHGEAGRRFVQVAHDAGRVVSAVEDIWDAATFNVRTGD